MSLVVLIVCDVDVQRMIALGKGAFEAMPEQRILGVILEKDPFPVNESSISVDTAE